MSLTVNGPGFRLKERIAAFNKFKATFPTVAGQLAVNHFKKSFRDGGFTDAALVPWKPRKRNAKRNIGRALLVDTGDLRRSVKVKAANWDYIKVGSDLIYAKVHNEGEHAGRGHGFKMPKRQFIGHSRVLMKKIILKLKGGIDRIWKI